MKNQTLYSYYVYAGVLVRVDKKTKQLEIWKRISGIWKKSHDPILWKRIQLEGEMISQEEAKRIFLRNISE